MEPDAIDCVADSLEEARERAKQRIPEGFRIKHEEIISDGKEHKARGVATTIDAALDEARSRIPSQCDVFDHEVIARPGSSTVEITASDEEEARRLARERVQDVAEIREVKMATAGRKGFLGIGRSPNCYEVDIEQHAVVEISYRGKARIRLSICRLPSRHELRQSAQCERRAIEVFRGLQVPEDYFQNDSQARTAWVDLVAHRTIVRGILADAKALLQDVAAIRELNLGNIDEDLDYAEIPTMERSPWSAGDRNAAAEPWCDTAGLWHIALLETEEVLTQLALQFDKHL